MIYNRKDFLVTVIEKGVELVDGNKSIEKILQKKLGNRFTVNVKSYDLGKYREVK